MNQSTPVLTLLICLALPTQAAETTPDVAACTSALSRADSPTAISGSDRSVSILQCAASGQPLAMAVALFSASEVKTPICVAPLELANPPKSFFNLKRQELAVRSASDKSFVVVANLKGGTPYDEWTSLIFVRVDESCRTTPLARIYSRMHYDDDDASKCEGTQHGYRFVDASRVEVQRHKVHCTATDEQKSTTVTTLDLDALAGKPESRVFEP